MKEPPDDADGIGAVLAMLAAIALVVFLLVTVHSCWVEATPPVETLP